MRLRSLYAHCTWLDQVDRVRMTGAGATMMICPTSNLFLGSGLFDFHVADAALSLGTDVEAGTNFPCCIP